MRFVLKKTSFYIRIFLYSSSLLLLKKHHLYFGMDSSVVVPIWMLLLLPFMSESCTVHVESVNCTHKEITNVHFTCHSNADHEACSCIFEDPIINEFGWYKMCVSKGDSKIGKKKVRKRQIRVPDNCASIQPPRPGKLSCIWSPREIVCTGACYSGFIFVDGKKEQRLSCRSSEGFWKPAGIFPACEPLPVCAFSKNSLPSSWHCNHNNEGTFCDISCHAPGTPESYRDIQRYSCNVDGLWTPQLPPCVQVISLCKDPGALENGRRFIRSQTFLLGSTVSYECNEGYAMTGNSVLTCESNKQWSSEKPSCVLKPVPVVLGHCPKPNSPKNAVLSVIFPDSNPLQNIFNSELPLLQQLYLTLSGNSSEKPKSDLQSLSDGLFMVGTRVQYKCKSRFYKLYGSEYQTCLPSLTWSGYQPACVPECGKSDSPKTPFVVNGNATQVGQWPWMVAIALKGNRGLQFLCGGVLITDTWILTAAHCVTKKLSNIPMDPQHFLVFCGKYYRAFTEEEEFVQIKPVKQIVVHAEYDFTQFDSDIALVQLERAVELTTRVQPICLPTESTTRENIRDDQKGIVLGWGLTENSTFSETLRETVLPVVNHDKCEEAYREGLRTVTITENMFCAGYDSGSSDTCNGDSGGPFMFSVGPSNDKRWYLEGIVSWGSESGCAKANRYSGFTKVGRFVPWINMYI